MKLTKGCYRNQRNYLATPGGKATTADTEDETILEDFYNDNITTPGLTRFSVCSADIAYRAWDYGSSPDTDALKRPTSDASLTVLDRMQIMKNIANTNSKWEVENAIRSQHQFVQYGSYAFCVQGKGKHGNIDFPIGAQDTVSGKVRMN
ncbi:hypothetical protein ETB97_006013 [Aspergillus alliaceus]|uniref:Ecp2 effector protein-like domain-containing protein n=1 Tax=Petromyces alliaceus TaxID=209559 RepID=A0A8H5ZUW6_PETAA|nr:hypothetical protein ETB97_006013 [Aspergillus burnettii]